MKSYDIIFYIIAPATSKTNFNIEAKNTSFYLLKV
jgi:hypothetical protein